MERRKDPGPAGKRRLIRASLERCAERSHLREGAAKPILRLQDDELALRRERFEERAGGAFGREDGLAFAHLGRRLCLLVSDPESFVVEAHFGDAVGDELMERGIGAGGLWDEKSAGTNGVDMARRAAAPLTVAGSDHFHRVFHGFACSSAPLFDDRGAFSGALTIVAPNLGPDADHGLVERALELSAEQFRARMFRRRHDGAVTARLRDRERPAAAPILAALDRDGVVRAVLRPPGEAPNGADPLLGKSLAALKAFEIEVRAPARALGFVDFRGKSAQAERPAARRATARSLRALARQGGGLEQAIDRAVRLIAKRVPVTLTGESGVGKTELARLLLDTGDADVFRFEFDAAEPVDAAAVLRSAAHFCRHGSGGPQIVVFGREVQRANASVKDALNRFLAAAETLPEKAAPIVVFTLTGDWEAMRPTFGDELHFRVGQALIETPPLRARDVGRALDALLAEFDGPNPEPSKEARAVLLAHDWPGNLRELRNALKEAQAMSEGKTIGLADLPPRLVRGRPTPVGAPRSLGREALENALERAGWNVAKAARLMGKSRATLNRWIAEEGLTRPSRRRRS